MSETKRVLVVENDRGIRELLAEALDSAAYQVLTASNGARALVDVWSQQAKLVLLDLMMTVLNSWQFLEGCPRESLCAEMPVLVMSAHHALSKR